MRRRPWKDRPRPSISALRHACEVDNLTHREFADRYGWDVDTIRLWCKRHGIKRDPSRPTKAQLAAIDARRKHRVPGLEVGYRVTELGHVLIYDRESKTYSPAAPAYFAGGRVPVRERVSRSGRAR